MSTVFGSVYIMPERRVIRVAPEPPTVAMVIREKREKNKDKEGWRQEDIAKQLKVDPSTVNGWENGRVRVFTRKRLRDLAREYDIPFEQLQAIQTERQDWEDQEREPLQDPGWGIAPGGDAIRLLLFSIKDWEDDEILALQARVAEVPEQDRKRTLGAFDWDGDRAAS